VKGPRFSFPSAFVISVLRHLSLLRQGNRHRKGRDCYIQGGWRREQKRIRSSLGSIRTQSTNQSELPKVL
jgi:hypothetical protein